MSIFTKIGQTLFGIKSEIDPALKSQLVSRGMFSKLNELSKAGVDTGKQTFAIGEGLEKTSVLRPGPTKALAELPKEAPVRFSMTEPQKIAPAVTAAQTVQRQIGLQQKDLARPTTPFQTMVQSFDRQKFIEEQEFERSFGKAASNLRLYKVSQGNLTQDESQRLSFGQALDRPMTEEEELIRQAGERTYNELANFAFGAVGALENIEAKALRKLSSRLGRKLTEEELEISAKMLRKMADDGLILTEATEQGVKFADVRGKVTKQIGKGITDDQINKIVDFIADEIPKAKPVKAEPVQPTKFYTGSKGQVTQADLNLADKKIKTIQGDQRSLYNVKTYPEADQKLIDDFGGDFDIVKVEHPEMPQKADEYLDLRTGTWYSPDKNVAKVYAMQDRGGKYEKGVAKKPIPDEQVEAEVTKRVEQFRKEADLMAPKEGAGVVTRDVTDARGNLLFQAKDFKLSRAKGRMAARAADMKEYAQELLYDNDPEFRELVDRLDEIRATQIEQATDVNMIDDIFAEINKDITKLKQYDKSEVKQAYSALKEAERKAGIPGKRGLQKVGLAKPEKKITKTESELLKIRVKAEAQTAKKVAESVRKVTRETIIAQLRSEFGTKLEGIKRKAELKDLRIKIEQRYIQKNKADITQYIKDNLPLEKQGLFINKVRDAKTKKDVIKAFARVDAKVDSLRISEAISNLKKSIDNASDNNRISVDYRNKIKAILDQYELTGHSKQTLDKLQATQDYINKQLSVGEDVEMPQRIMDKLKILGRTAKKDLTLNQIQALQDEVDLMVQLGETKQRAKEAIYKAELEERKAQLLESATSIKSREVKNIGLEKNPKKYAQIYFKGRDYLLKTSAGLTPIEGLADITGMQPMKNVMDLNFGNYLVYNDETFKQWLELTKDMDEASFKRIGAYAISKQDGGIERLENNNLTKEQIDNLNLTPEEKQVYNFVREKFDAEFPGVKKYMADVYNVDVGQVKNYVSFISNTEALNDLDIYDRFGERPDITIRKKRVDEGFTKERAEESVAPLELNIDKIFTRHMDDVAYMKTMGRDIKQYFEIVNSPELRAKLGDIGATAWLDYLDLMARKGGSEGAKRIAALDVLRKNLAAGVLAYRISSALVQVTSFADTMGTIGVEWATKGAHAISTSREWRDFIMDNFPEIRKAVGDDIAFRDFNDNMFTKFNEKGLKPLQYLDGLMRSNAAAGAYMKLAQEAGLPVDLANPNKDLIQQATKLMRQSQGSSFFKDQPLSLTTNFGLTNNRSLNKFILTFQSFMLNRWDNLNRQIWRMGIKEKDYKKASMSFFWMVIFAAALEETIRRTSKKAVGEIQELITGEEPKELESIGKEFGLNVIQNVPLAGQIISGLNYSANPIPVINSYERTIGGLKSVITGKELNTKLRGAINLLGGFGTLIGLGGSSQAAELLQGLVPKGTEKAAYPSGSKPTLPKPPKPPRPPKPPKPPGR